MRIKTHTLILAAGVCLAAIFTSALALSQEWNNGAGNGSDPTTQTGPIGQSSATRSIVPGPPQQAEPAVRPATWPGAMPNAPAGISQQNGPIPVEQMQPYQGSQIIARVGNEVILESDLIKRIPKDLKVEGSIDHLIEVYKSKTPFPDVDDERRKLIAELLPVAIQWKALYYDARRAIPTEGWPQIEQHMNQVFDEVVLEKLMEAEGVSSRRELDDKYRSLGTTLEREKRAFLEMQVGQQYLYEKTRQQEEITYDQMLEYYQNHLEEFKKPARVRWEELMVNFSKYPDQATAYDAIARLGNQVYSGVAFAQVARTSSDGYTASDGGKRKWTEKGVLAKELDQAIFGLPVGQLSQIIEGPTGFHIVRVTEREEATTPTFVQSQAEIRKRINEERTMKLRTEYFAKVQAKTPIWTVFDAEARRARIAERQQQSMTR